MKVIVSNHDVGDYGYFYLGDKPLIIVNTSYQTASSMAEADDVVMFPMSALVEWLSNR